MLFKKSVSELREGFVRGRFAEENYFGRANIEKWLEKQKKARHPDVEQWNHCCSFGDRLMLFAHSRPIELLREYAEPLARVPQDMGYYELDEQIQHRAKLRPLLEGLDPKSFEVYYPYVHSPIIIWKGECEAGPEAFYWDLSADASGRPRTIVKYEAPSPMVMDAIFATWWRHTPKAAKARELLCDLVALDIAQVRREAEADFAEAIGVTADGEKILRANIVVVVPPRGVAGPTRLYRDTRVFQDNKILRRHKGSLTVEVDTGSSQDFEKKILKKVKDKEMEVDLFNWSQVC
ncbi:MAG: hypothetical protein AAB780_00370, partial [Patescibacteria group bacterium]